MKTVSTIGELKAEVRAAKAAGQSIGLVPTMGFLHEGHLTLARQAKADNDLLIMSIFVNPLQFGPNEDFDRYPRDVDRDKQLAEDSGVDVLFIPSVKEMYPNEPVVTMKVVDRTEALCGQKRVGHFDGVVTVVTKLFHLSEADRAYFGKKDAQQLAVLKGLADTFNFPVDIRAVDTVREEDGLAKSSRNVYLTESERRSAPAIYEALQKGKQAALEGTYNRKEVIELAASHLEKHGAGRVDYIELLTYPELKPVQKMKGELILAAAVHFSKSRLIDNIIFTV